MDGLTARLRGKRQVGGPGWGLCALLGVLVLLAPLLARAENPAKAESRPELVAVVPVSLPPLYPGASGGEMSGYAVELLRKVAGQAGYAIRLEHADNIEEALRMLREGRAHLMPGAGISARRQGRLLFTRPIEALPVHIFTRLDAPPLEDLASLRGKRVAVLSGSIPEERLDTEPGVHLVRLQSLSQGIFDLLTGQADALVLQAQFVEAAARASGVEGKLRASKAPLLEVTRGIGVAPGSPDLLDELDRALEQYRKTKDFEELYARWHSVPARRVLSAGEQWGLGLALAMLAGGLLLWRNQGLRRGNRRLVQALAERDQALAALRLSQERMETLFTLSTFSEGEDGRLVDFALKEGVRLTGSVMGFILFFKDDAVDFSTAHWTASSFGHPPLDAPTRYPLSEAGLWARCMETREPLLVNDYAASSLRRGLPEGHPELKRIMAVPMVEGGRVVAVLAVANKDEDYDANDARQLQLFLVGLWNVLASRRDAVSIRESRDYAESLVEGANAMLVGVDAEGRAILFNAAAEQISGYRREDILGRDWCEVMLPPGEAKTTAGLHRDFLAGRAALPRRHEGALRTREGGIRHISWQYSLLCQGEAATGLLAFGIDITEQKKAEAELRQLHSAIHQAEEGVIIADQFGAIIYANPAFQRMAGREEQQIVGGSVFDLDLDLLEHHSAAVRGDGAEGSWRGTCSVSRPGQAPVEVEFAVVAVLGPEEQLLSYAAVCRDVTERRKLEHQLWQAQKMDALGTLAGGIAHDFNNLLASIMGFTELAQESLPEGSSGRDCLSRVLGASQRARELVRRILSFSRRSEQRLRLIDADAALSEAARLMEATLGKNIRMEVELASGATLLADPAQIHQIAMNLCTNAAQAMQEHGGRLALRSWTAPLSAELAARWRLSPGDYFFLAVEDQGAGIALDILPRIFEPFFTTKGPGEGTGLGLSVVHGIVTSLGGAVWAESEPGQGARVQVLLPAQPGELSPGAEAHGAEAPREALPGSGRLLLVDDEPEILELGRRSLEPLGYAVTTEADPEEALRLLLDRPDGFDLLLTDMHMPRLSGVHLVEALREKLPRLPVVLITGFSRAAPPEWLEAAGPAALLHKPFSTAELAAAVRQALARSEATDSAGAQAQ